MASVYKSDIYKRYFKEAGSLSKYAMERKARSGDMPGCAPVGYRNSHDGRKKTVIIDPEKAHIVQIAFRLAGESGLPLREVMRTVTKLGLVSRNGKPLGPSALWGILTNPFYAGFIRFHGGTLKGSHEALISTDLFQQAQTSLAKRRKRI